MAGNHFVHKADGSLYVAPVWPGPAVFPDFTRASTREWWGNQYKDFIADGFSGFWNDMNEPAVFETPTKTMPLDNLHRIESDDFAARTATHAEIHNVYGMQNTRGTFEGMKRLRPGARPFVMTRASYAGGQRYAVTWTGDNSSTWDHLRLCVAATDQPRPVRLRLQRLRRRRVRRRRKPRSAHPLVPNRRVPAGLPQPRRP